jgi:hypothetical protein
MNRRGFFGSLFQKRDSLLFFGLQVAVNTYGEDETRLALHRVIASGGSVETPEQKRSFYKRIAALLLENQPFFEYGYWDYLTDSDDAGAEFEQWVNEIEGSMATEEEELGEVIDEVHRMSSDKSYVVMTVAFLLEPSKSQENALAMIDSIPEDDYFSRDSFRKLIEAVTFIDFEFTQGDAAFIMPGNEMDGISWEDIHGEGWNYLKPVMA